MATRAKKRNFTAAEIDVLVEQVGSRQKVLLGSLSDGMTNVIKTAAWEKVTRAVNAAGSERRSLQEVKKKWFDIKLSVKKRIAAQQRRQQDASAAPAAAEGKRDAAAYSPLDVRIAGIIGCACVVESEEGAAQPAERDAPDAAAADGRETAGAPAAGLEEPEDKKPPPLPLPPLPPPPPPPLCVPVTLTDVVLQNQDDTSRALSDIRDQLSGISSVLAQINESMKQIASCAAQLVNKL